MPTQDQHQYHFKLSDECCLCYTQTHTHASLLRGKLLFRAATNDYFDNRLVGRLLFRLID